MTTLLLRAWLAVLVLSAASPPASALDANGKWLFYALGDYGVIVPVTQSGNTLSFVIPAWPFGLAYTGTLTPAGDFTTYEVTAGNPVSSYISGRFMPSGNMFDARRVDSGGYPYPYSVGSWVVTRCTCDDGNTANGDGCSSECRIEPCWTCTGDPSVCTPAAEASACEDGSVCTTGETCTSGACGGGAPVSSCVDMSGLWYRGTTVSGGGNPDYTSTDVVQRGTDLIFASASSNPSYGPHVGTIDPFSGAFDVRGFSTSFFCNSSTLLGTVAPSGMSYVASGGFALDDPYPPPYCNSFDVNEIGLRFVGPPVGVPSLSRPGVMLLVSALFLSAFAMIQGRRSGELRAPLARRRISRSRSSGRARPAP